MTWISMQPQVGFSQDNCCFDIHCVLVIQVNDQKIQWLSPVFFSYKAAVVNYRWEYFSLLLVFLGSIESQKSNYLFTGSC